MAQAIIAESGLLAGRLTPIARQRPAPTRASLPLAIHLDPLADSPIRRYGLAELCIALGAPFEFNPARPSAVYVGVDATRGGASLVWVRPSAHSDWSSRPPTLTLLDGKPVLHHGAAPARAVSGQRVEFDIAMAAAFWLTLQSEAAIRGRDPHGRPPAVESMLGHHGLLHHPPISAYAALLSGVLWPGGAPAGFRPRWPGGRTWAVAMTHDVDQPERAMTARSLLGQVITGHALSRRQAYHGLRSEVRARGWREALVASPQSRREWDFDHWCELEARHGLRSAFYFATVHRDGGHTRDVDYDVHRRRYRRLMRRLRHEGFEVGLHAGYATRWALPPIRDQVEELTGIASQSIAGVRHHYLQLDHDDPMRSLADQSSAGLRYDTTIGFNDAPGCRAGTALPFRPYHPRCGVVPNFVELPMTLADMHLTRNAPDAATRAVLDHLWAIRRCGGLAVLNWHVGHWESDPAWRAAAEAACKAIAEDGQVWRATPREIADWWRLRADACLKTDSGTTDIQEAIST